jgi:hypothetical protein
MEQLVRGRPRARVPVLAALVVLALALVSGCETRAQEAPKASAPAAALLVTADYGARELLTTRVAPDQSVMRALRGATAVRTAYSGGFVSEMLGLASDPSGPRDWFYFVNGIESAVGAKTVRLAAGDGVWWDFRNWSLLVSAPAVVGQWPAPMVLPGGRGPSVSADPPLRAALEAFGADLAESDSPWRVRVGASTAIARRDDAWRRALADPDGSGLTITIRDGAIVALTPDGARRVRIPGARALVAAVASGTAPEDGVVVVVAGLDAAAAQAAARTVAADPGVLRGRYAVAFDGAGQPLVAGGRSMP